MSTSASTGSSAYLPEAPSTQHVIEDALDDRSPYEARLGMRGIVFGLGIEGVFAAIAWAAYRLVVS